MSLNTAHANGGVLIYAGERILIYYDGIELVFEGQNSPHFKGKKKGRIFLTTHRVIFNSIDPKEIMQSFSMPFLNLREVELEQPIFGANYIKGKVVAEPYGNWTGEIKFKMHFSHGGAIEFGQAMLEAARLASRNRPPQPPPYSTAPPGNIYQAPPPSYAPPNNEYFAWVPYQTFPTAPPPQYIFTHDAPPPYPGVDPTTTPYQNNLSSQQDGKMREAASCAYYDPSYPHNIYAQPTAPLSEAPPAYEQVTKKTN